MNFLLGLLVLAAWHSLAASLPRGVTAAWYAAVLTWFLLRACWLAGKAIKWGLSKEQAGAWPWQPGAPGRAPAERKGE
jgi:hypothetical protein